MYDTVNIWLGKDEAGNADLLASVPSFLTGVTMHQKEGETWATGKLNNYKIWVSDHGISLQGSLAKFYLGDNIHTLTRGDGERAIEKMSDILHLPLKKATVRRFDVAQNFIMKYPVGTYYPCLGDARYYQRLRQPDSITYTNSKRQLAFYNKVKEVKAKGIIIPEIYKGSNLLRYEDRFMKRLPQQFNMPKVMVSTLFHEPFYLNVVNRWKDEYSAINKLSLYLPEVTEPMTAAESQKQLFASLILQVGQNAAMKVLDQWYMQNLFTSEREYYRAKDQIIRMMKKAAPDKDEVIAELDKKVKQVVKYCR